MGQNYPTGIQTHHTGDELLQQVSPVCHMLIPLREETKRKILRFPPTEKILQKIYFHGSQLPNLAQ